MSNFLFTFTLITLSQLTSLQYIEVVRVKDRISPKEYAVTLIDTKGKTKDVALRSEKIIRVKVFSRATVRYLGKKDNYEQYQLIYVEPTQRQAQEPTGSCTWGQCLRQ